MNKHSAFNKFERKSLEDLNLSLTIYYYDLYEDVLEDIKNIVNETIQSFQSSFFRLDLAPYNKKLKIVNIYIFPDREAYVSIGPQMGIPTGNGGYTQTNNFQNYVQSEVFVYMAGAPLNLRHEVTHALMCNVNRHVPSVVSEGVADYIEHGCQKVSGTRLRQAKIKLDGLCTLKEFLDIESGDDVYYGGLLLVSFFETKHPDYLDNLFKAIVLDPPPIDSQSQIDSEAYENEFSEWLRMLDLEVSERDALKVEKGPLIKGNVYRANITGEKGRVVGHFPMVEYMYFMNTLRAYCQSTGDYVDVSPEYAYLKIQRDRHDELYGILCDLNGNSYYDTEEFKLQTKRMFPEKLPSSKKVDNLYKLLRNLSFDNVHNDSGSEYLFKSLEEHKALELEELSDRIAATPWISYMTKVELEQFEQLDQDAILKISPQLSSTEENKNNRVYVAASLYSGEKKIGELHSATGLYEVSKSGHNTFVYNDTPANMHVKYNATCYLSKDKNTGCLRFVQHITNESPPSIKLDSLFNVDPSYVWREVYERLDPNIDAPPEIGMTMNEYSIERGRLLDDKGTDRVSDDVYEAVLKKGDKIITVLKFVGMYSIKDTLFVHDFGRGTRHQLPRDIRHLKLVKKEKDSLYLCPWSVEKSSFWDEKLLIDPAILHTYDEGKQKKKTGLVEVDGLVIGSIFECRPADGQVEIYYDGKKVGKMAAEQHTFLHNIFLSADYNYSFIDFLATKFPDIRKDEKESFFRFKVGAGDYPTNRGYTTHQRIYIK